MSEEREGERVEMREEEEKEDAALTLLRHWLHKLLLVTVKLTKVTLEHRSGGNSTEGSQVDRKIVKEGDKSIS